MGGWAGAGENEPVVECSRPSGGQAVLGRFVEMALGVVGSISEGMAIVLLEGEVEMALARLFLLLASGGGVGLAPEERYGSVVLEHAFFW